MELKHVVNKDEPNRSVEMLLYGAIGAKVDGDYFAQEINYLAKEYDEIHIRINSEGGSVLQGLSVFNAILNSNAFVICTIEGVAASMAGVIPMAADLVRMNDFARLMVHDPSIGGRANLSKKERKGLNSIKTMLTDLLSRRGVESDKMASFMAEETWFNATEALELKLIDEVVNTGKADEVKNAFENCAVSADDYMNFIDIPQTKKEDMKQIAALLGLAENATEAEIMAAITKMQNAAAELKELANSLKAAKADAEKSEAETLVNQVIEDGLYKEEQRGMLTKMATDNFDTFKTMVSHLEKPAAGSAEGESLTAAIRAESAANVGNAAEVKDFEWYRHNDPEALTEMQTTNKAKFDKLYAAWEGNGE